MMDFRDWIFAFVSLAVGIGSSLITNWVAMRRSRQDQLRTRRADLTEELRDLQDYERVLRDIAADWEESLFQQLPGCIGVRYYEYIDDCRVKAYHHFHRFTEAEKPFLRWPTYTNSLDPNEGPERVSRAIDIVEGRLKVLRREIEQLDERLEPKRNLLGFRWIGYRKPRQARG